MDVQSLSYHKLFERDLTKLREEIGLYKNDNQLWAIKAEIKNSGGNLALHLCGNLQTYIGLILGGYEYTRDRLYEFSAKHLPREKVIDEIDQTKKVVLSTLIKLSTEELEKKYPKEELGFPMTNAYFILHLICHLNYHLGQINYHRRLFDIGT